MIKMQVYNIYFSPTGGTKKVSDIIIGAISDSYEEIDLLKKGSFNKCFDSEDVCIISVPAFGGRVPQNVCEKIKEFKANGARVALVAVFGNRAIDDTLLELRDILEAAGFVCAAAMETVAEHSIFRQFGAARPDAEDEAELKDFAAKAAELLKGEQAAEGQLHVPGNYPYRERKPAGMIPEGKESCTGCGICTSECPVHAIPADEPKSVNRETCFGCMRCVSVCPGGHRDVPEALREKMLPHIVNCHLHDNDGNADYHRCPGAGNIDWKKTADLLRKAPRLKCIQSEVIPTRDNLPIKTLCETFRNIFPECE
jgi:ferredoxin